MRLLDRLIHGAGVVCRGGVLLCGSLAVLISFVIAFDVVARKVIGFSIVGVDEISGFILAISCSWGCAFALLHRAHVRVETVQLVLSPRTCAILDMVSLIVLGAFVSTVGWYGANVLNMSIEMGSNADMLDVSLWIPQVTWVAGYMMFVILAVLLILRAGAAFLAGDLTTLHTLIGSRSVAEEVEHEKQQVVAHREDTR